MGKRLGLYAIPTPSAIFGAVTVLLQSRKIAEYRRFVIFFLARGSLGCSSQTHVSCVSCWARETPSQLRVDPAACFIFIVHHPLMTLLCFHEPTPDESLVQF